MLPGQSHPIPAMGLPPGYAPMMQWEDPSGMPQQMIMMTSPTGQQIAMTSVYPMPQNVMMPGQQHFMPAPPPYTAQMASSFMSGSVRPSNDTPMNEEQRKKMEKELKQRQFMEQQRRLQGLSNLGAVKVDPDKLIESIIGKPEAVHRTSTAKLPNAAAAAAASKSVQSSDPGEDVFGDFLSSSAVNPARAVTGLHSSTAPPTNVSSYTGLQHQHVGKNALNASENNQQSLTFEAPLVKKTVESPKERKDLASMMMQCSDLSVPKEARRFEKKKTVNEIQVTKTVSVTYNESKTARHWDSSSDALSELFSVPASLQSQPPMTFEGVIGSPVVASEFKLPSWITGEIPIHNLYLQVLDAVTRDGVILTELVYPLLIQSGLPREVLGYIWELCNRQTPGLLMREELFLILAMISIAQNGLDYSTLAILSKCPQPPVPNLGQFVSSTAMQQTAQISGNASGMHSVGNADPAAGSAALAGTAALTSGFVDPSFQLKEPIPKSADLSFPAAPGAPGLVQNFGYPAHGTVSSLSANSVTSQHPAPAASISIASHSVVDDDEFEEFQAAPISHQGLSHSAINTVTGPVSLPQMPNPLISHGGDLELMKIDDDKYAAFRELSSLSSLDPPETAADAAIALENTVMSAVGDIAQPSCPADPDFTDFASFSSASDIPVSSVSTASSYSDTLFPSHLVSNSNSVVQNQAMDELSSFSFELQSSHTADTNKGYAAVKSLLNDPSVFAAKPLGGLSLGQMTVLSDSTVDNHELFDNKTTVSGGADVGWAAFASSINAGLPSQTAQPILSSGMVYGHDENCNDSSQGTSVTSKGINQTDDWAEFESASSLQNDNVDGKKHLPSPSIDSTALSESKPVIGGTKHMSMAKPDAAANKVQSFLGQTSSGKGASTRISPLDFHPPELPAEDDDFDDFAMYPTFPKDGNSSAGISSLSMHYLEGDHFDSLSEEKSVSSSTNGKTSAVLAQSNSSNSLEFTGWKLQSNVAVKEPDGHSTSSLELRHNKTNDFRDESPQQDGDSQSISSLDFPPIESEQKSTTDEQSVASLELKQTSPELDPVPPVENRTSDKMPQTADTPQSRFNFKESGHPVDLKELYEQGSLGKFGDRYSELTNEVQDSDRHAYEWQRCLEICCGFLSEGSSVFSSLSSSSVLHEILATNEGSTYLKGLIEIYFIARRIEEEMRFVSVSNSKLASILKDINVEWSDIATICAATSMIPDLSLLNFQSSFLKADDYEARRKSCGVCLLNVDVKAPDVSNGELGSRALGYGGRQYHTTCANFWINCVSKTLPSLTIPELL